MTTAHSQAGEFTNRLANEKSPYLLQHKHNPVDWYPWGEEAFEKARRENKIIFLSVGYSTCHWCHVMAHESFENAEIAQLMNELFVNIKVDREERPDVDKIYMSYVQLSTGGGGWPMSVWLTPDLKPIVGATYFPPKDAFGRPGFPTICKRIAETWRTRREGVIAQSESILEAVRESAEATRGGLDVLTDEPISACYESLARTYDEKLGGFGKAPKFPRPVTLTLLMRVFDREGRSSANGRRALEMTAATLTAMGRGGMFDHLGGGFHRYSVDKLWHVPHFEKMLYDQGQLVVSYLEAFQASKDPFFEQRARDVMDYVIRAMTSPEGGIYSAEDADSIIEHGKPEHAEGAFYVWTKDEIEQLLPHESAMLFELLYGVRADGNAPPGSDPHGEFVNKNILIQRTSLEEAAATHGLPLRKAEQTLADSRKVLFEVREKRPHPHLDDKIIVAWNGLMISAFAKGYQVLGDVRYLDAAQRAVKFIRDNLYKPAEGTLIRNYRQGPSNIDAFCEDYAMLISALLDLYEASFDVAYLDWALQLQMKQNELFLDASGGGFYSVKAGGKDLLLRMKEEYDGAEPSPNSVSALNLLRLAELTGHHEFEKTAVNTIKAFGEMVSRGPTAVPLLIVAIDMFLRKLRHIVIAGDKNSEDTKALIREVNAHFIPNKLLIVLDPNDVNAINFFHEKLEITRDMAPINGKATAFVCQNFTCSLPVNTPQALADLLQQTA